MGDCFLFGVVRDDFREELRLGRYERDCYVLLIEISWVRVGG